MKDTTHKAKGSHSALKAEWDALAEFGDRKARTVSAIFCAYRASGKEEFFVAPHIAERFRLSPKDLNWALDKLEGKLVESVGCRTKGKYRKMRLLAQWKGNTVTYPSIPEEEELVKIDRDAILAKVRARGAAVQFLGPKNVGLRKQ